MCWRVSWVVGRDMSVRACVGPVSVVVVRACVRGLTETVCGLNPGQVLEAPEKVVQADVQPVSARAAAPATGAHPERKGISRCVPL